MRFTTGLAWAVLAACAQANDSFDSPETVADPRYGVALYEYYQGHHRRALLELYVAESRGGISGHGDWPRVMEASFSLAYGMSQRAAKLFEQVLLSPAESETRAAAKFYLARLHYLRGNWEEAEAALAEAEQKLPKPLEQERLSLRLNLALQQNNPDRAVQLLQKQDQASERLPYIYYNIGAAYSRIGETATAAAYYNRLAELPLQTEAERALHDRAMIAAGHDYLQNEMPEQARAQFSRVRLSSPLAGSALLGYGWAAVEQEDFLDALAPWEKLAQRSLLDEHTQEALVAVPFAYEQLGQRGLALMRFEQAQRRLTEERERVNRVVEELREKPLTEVLSLETGGASTDGKAEARPAPQLVYLTELFSRESFQVRQQELRDLLDLRHNLRRWRERLSVYDPMLDERERRGVARLEALRDKQLAEQIAQIRHERARLAEELDRVEREKDYLALLSGHGADLRDRLDQAEQTMRALAGAGEDVEAYQQAHRRYAGRLFWQATERSEERLQRLRQELTSIDQILWQLEAARARVEAETKKAADLSSHRRALARGQARLDSQLRRIDGAIARLQEDLRGEILKVLREQQDQLDSYLSQARLAVARLYDSGRIEEQP